VRAADARANTVSAVSAVVTARAGAGLLAGVGSVWALRPRDGVATVVADGKTVEARLDSRALPFVWRDALWLAGVTASFTLPREELVFDAFAAGDDVWVVTNCGRVLRLDAGLRVLDSIRVSGVSQDFPTVMAAGSLWIGDQVRSDIVRVDPETNRLFHLSGGPAAVVAATAGPS
jgi:hypothetical protein